MFKLNKNYFFITIILLIIEMFIALFIHDRIVRPYIGDILVVILIFCFIKSFVNIKSLRIAVSVLVFAYFVELLQYLNLLDRLNLKGNKIAITLLGGSFDWIDLVNYTLGIIIILVIEKNVYLKRLLCRLSKT